MRVSFLKPEMFEKNELSINLPRHDRKDMLY